MIQNISGTKKHLFRAVCVLVLVVFGAGAKAAEIAFPALVAAAEPPTAGRGSFSSRFVSWCDLPFIRFRQRRGICANAPLPMTGFRRRSSPIGSAFFIGNRQSETGRLGNRQQAIGNRRRGD